MTIIVKVHSKQKLVSSQVTQYFDKGNKLLTSIIKMNVIK